MEASGGELASPSSDARSTGVILPSEGVARDWLNRSGPSLSWSKGDCRGPPPAASSREASWQPPVWPAFQPLQLFGVLLVFHLDGEPLRAGVVPVLFFRPPTTASQHGCKGRSTPWSVQPVAGSPHGGLAPLRLPGPPSPSHTWQGQLWPQRAARRCVTPVAGVAPQAPGWRRCVLWLQPPLPQGALAVDPQGSGPSAGSHLLRRGP
uniref:Uncharacterized protein n=1 Tax=Rangifer tarandus platyrhynchus TaxID=3082113 RepID=A0ACB0EWB1_RANTA|nr:unnamed protein product [Rangifer tarandus platyrhynchus]